jgi:hypothetical protein
MRRGFFPRRILFIICEYITRSLARTSEILPMHAMWCTPDLAYAGTQKHMHSEDWDSLEQVKVSETQSLSLIIVLFLKLLTQLHFYSAKNVLVVFYPGQCYDMRRFHSPPFLNGGSPMFHRTLPRLSVIAASLLLLQAPLSAKKCKSFNSLVVKCALTAAQLTVSGNASIGGNLTVGGTINSTGSITTSGTITAANVTNPAGTTFGDLLSYGNWINTAGGPVAIDANVTFPTSNINTSNVTQNGTFDVFTFTLPGTYLVLYQVTYSALAASRLDLEKSIDSGTSWNAVTGGSVLTGTVGVALNQEVSNASLVTIAAGNQLRLHNAAGLTLLTLPAGGAASVAGITFIRLHA